jgi:nucleotide-binding universal stress UspA family protein
VVRVAGKIPDAKLRPAQGDLCAHSAMAASSHPGLRLRRILLATDFSPRAQAALAYAACLARDSAARLYVAHVIEARPWKLCPELALRRRNDATRRLEQALASSACKGIRVQPVIRHGAAVAQIVEVAEGNGVDLIVTGTRGCHRLRRLLLGSAAAKLAQCAPCPVLTVGPGARAAPNGEVVFRNIVLATSLNPGAASGIAFARSFAQRHGAKLWVAHSLRPGDGATPIEAVDAWMKKIVPDQPRVERVPRLGSVEQVTVMLAERESADLVMLGPGLGSMLPQVARHVACPVMIVRYAIPMIRPKSFGVRPALSS